MKRAIIGLGALLLIASAIFVIGRAWLRDGIEDNFGLPTSQGVGISLDGEEEQVAQTAIPEPADLMDSAEGDRAMIAAVKPDIRPTKKIVLTGRAVDQSGEPLQSVQVTAHPRDHDAGDHQVRTKKVQSGADGAFEIVSSVEHNAVTVTLVLPGRVKRELYIQQGGRWSSLDFGDVILANSASIQGVVVDESDNELAGVRVILSHPDYAPIIQPSGTAKEWRPSFSSLEMMSEMFRTGEQGEFSLTGIRAGVWKVKIHKFNNPELVLVGPTSIATDDDQPTKIVAHKKPFIQGTLIHENGEPISRQFQLYAINARTDTRASREWFTGKNGEFALYLEEPELQWEACKIVLRAAEHYGYELRQPAEIYWGETDLRVVLSPRRSFVISATSAETKTPIADCLISCQEHRFS